MTLRTAIVATYPPRHCGIASFAHDLARATGSTSIVALHPPGAPTIYPMEVRYRIRRDVAADYPRTARALVRDGVEPLSIQHMVWPEVGTAYRVLFDRVARSGSLVAADRDAGRIPRALLRAIPSRVLDA